MSTPNIWTATRERDWAELQEQGTLALQGAALDAGKVTRGTRMLDAGCGTGILAVLARMRGAVVTAVDSSPAMLNVARTVLPGIDVRQADLKELPFAAGTFDSVVAVNSIFFAPDIPGTVRELGRVARSGGRVVVTCWGPAERCEYTAMRRAMAALNPNPPAPAGPGSGVLAGEGAAQELFRQAGLRFLDQGEVTCQMAYASADHAWQAHSSTGPTQAAIQTYGEAAVRKAIEQAEHEFTRPDGTVRFRNLFLWAVAEKD